MPRTKTTRNPFGSIFQRQIKKHGRKITVYDARKRYVDSGGNKKEKFKRCLTYAEAMTQLGNFQNEIREELKAAETSVAANENRTFSELVEYYRAEYVKPAVFNKQGRKITGFRRRLQHIKTSLELLDRHFGALRLRSITYEDLRKFRENYAQSKTIRDELPAQSTVNEKMSMLRRLFNIAIQKEWLDVSPFKRGDSLIDKAGETKRNRMLTFEEEKRLLKACAPGERLVPYKRNKRFTTDGIEEQLTAKIFIDRSNLAEIIVCALDTAMRRGEIFNLKWKQVDLDRRVIYLTEEAARDTKTGEEGVLPMTSRLHEILSEKKKGGGAAGDFVFKRFEFKRAFQSACNEAGIKDLQFRDLRATSATRMVLAGNAESQVMKITRHRNLKIFLEHYTNVNIQNAQKVGSNLDDFLEKGGSKVKAKENEEKAASENPRKAA